MTDDQSTIALAYAAGKRRIDCPVCNGGESHDRMTMTLQANDVDGLTGFCWRASCKAFLRCEGADLAAPVAFEPKPLREAYRLVAPGDWWAAEYFKASGMMESTAMQDARQRGLRVLVSDPYTCVWKLRALDYAHIGHITRTTDKVIRTFKELDRPLYYSQWTPSELIVRELFIFEDPLSAAICRRPAMALLGTSISDGVIQEIKRAEVRRAFVCLDPGAEDEALKVYTKLVYAGVPAVFVPMSKDFKNMLPKEREALIGAYA